MSARPRPRAFLWAAILPLVVLGIAAWILEKGRSNADEREMRNAGRIVNGHLTHGGTAKFIEDSLRQHRPEVIVLGNSLANTDIQPALLARRLGLPPKKVQRYSVPNSLAPHWYAILKNRVYANGRQPRVVIVLSDLQSLVAVRPRSEASYLNLATQLGDSEPVIDAKLGRGNFGLERVRENRGRVRERSLTMVRNASINLLQNGTLSLEERARDKQALDRTFDDRNVDMRLHQQVSVSCLCLESFSKTLVF